MRPWSAAAPQQQQQQQQQGHMRSSMEVAEQGEHCALL
jgi:hypothetical protein